MGRRLAGEGSLSEMGYFHLVFGEGGSERHEVVGITAVSGDVVDLPVLLQGQHFTLEHPLHFGKASIHSGLIKILVAQIFTDAGTGLVVPECLPYVPRGPASSGSQAAPPPREPGAEPARAPQGHGGAI